ncbi:pleckstrin homology domain-containing family D member 1-like [Saccoglossus kowalevskii]|uniref:Pleckstrin homology domain-containing family D member 1-like n=1 Tax=Saccoglossus kowalevskii TaxID=10224 RepID=A0ABM0GR47_SACKO|nr:PREDICTED: pleckstrin homology domain-containing family D member 1-like [Saccoglossus kowalevskii]
MTNNLDDFDISTRVQMWGVLWKRPFGHSARNWSKRFFVVKEGFLLYYSENEKKDFEKKRHFNIHPKGVIPLGNSIISSIDDPLRNWSFKIEHEDYNGVICLAADTENERERWVEVLRQSGRVTWKNAQLGDTMIQTLETQGLQLAKESQDYKDRLHTEICALRDEMDRNEELERIAAELEIEKKKIEETAKEMQNDLERNKLELEETVQLMKQVENDKHSLNRNNDRLQDNLQLLAKEKEKTLQELQHKELVTKKLSSENQSLSQTTESLKSTLNRIEEKTKQLVDEKKNTEKRLKEKEREAKALDEEKKLYVVHAQELQSSLHDLTIQKEMTDNELREEIIARREAERRLKDAEAALARLEIALGQTRRDRTNSVEVEISHNVATLKRFFEDIAEEAKIDIDKPLIMKNALHARKSFIRKTRSFKHRRARAKSAEPRLSSNAKNRTDDDRRANMSPSNQGDQHVANSNIIKTAPVSSSSNKSGSNITSSSTSKTKPQSRQTQL